MHVRVDSVHYVSGAYARARARCEMGRNGGVSKCVMLELDKWPDDPLVYHRIII
jgi:hypothetical protein